MTNRLLAVVATGLSALLSAGRPMPSTRPAASQVREIADTTLQDIAVAVYDSISPVIYYNPVVVQRLGPELSTFFMAHEHAHIALRHMRAGALRGDSEDQDRRLQQKELEADCMAATMLAVKDPSAVAAALRWFERQGPTSYDRSHPNGLTRAAAVRRCSIAATAQTGHGRVTGQSPAGIDLDVTVILRTDPITVCGEGRDFRLWIDGRVVAAGSNRYQSSYRPVALQPGTYSYRLEVTVYSRDDWGQFTRAGLIKTEGKVNLVAGVQTLSIDRHPGHEPTLR